MVSRIDVYWDFVYNEMFDEKRFKSKLRRRGKFVSGKKDEGVLSASGKIFEGSGNPIGVGSYEQRVKVKLLDIPDGQVREEAVENPADFPETAAADRAGVVRVE